jgi:hypothetical protein
MILIVFQRTRKARLWAITDWPWVLSDPKIGPDQNSTIKRSVIGVRLIGQSSILFKM